MSIQRYIFSLGSIYLTDLSGGAVGAGATSVKLCDLNEFSVEISAKSVEGKGQDNFPAIVQRGDETLKGKIKFLRFDPRLVAEIYHGVKLNKGMIQAVPDEEAVAAATVNCANKTTWLYDHQVINALTGAEFTRLGNSTDPATLTAGEYIAQGGVYKFSAADEAAAVPVLLNYAREDNTAGWNFEVTSRPQGTTPIFQIHAQNVVNTASGYQTDDIIVYAATATGYKEGRKAGEFCYPEIDVMAMKSAAGKVYRRFGNSGTY